MLLCEPAALRPEGLKLEVQITILLPDQILAVVRVKRYPGSNNLRYVTDSEDFSPISSSSLLYKFNV